MGEVVYERGKGRGGVAGLIVEYIMYRHKRKSGNTFSFS